MKIEIILKKNYLKDKNKEKDDKIKVLEALAKKKQSTIDEKEHLVEASQFVDAKLQNRMCNDRKEWLIAKNDVKEKCVLQNLMKEMQTRARNSEVECEEVDKLKNEVESMNAKLSY